MTTPVFPFTAVLGQNELKDCLLLNAVDPGIGGVLALGDRGTGKSTTVRALGQLLETTGIPAPVVDLPLGATEDRVLGSLDISAALADGQRRFAPGLLSDAHGGFLYIDEVNLLDDYLVDLLLDVAASGINRVERDGISHTHPARFVLIGSGNPEEGELRPQLEDRFGLATTVTTIADLSQRTEIVRRRLAFDADPEGFTADYAAAEAELGERIAAARRRLEQLAVPDATLEHIVRLCIDAGAVGHRAEIVLMRAARAYAALESAHAVTENDVSAVARLTLRHRVPRESYETNDDIERRLTRLVA
ncbi:MAG TPA: AAA family ATPase [Gryllotalpicola sp.]